MEVLRESICISGNVTLMDVYNHLYITVCQAKEIQSESRDKGFVPYTDIVDKKWDLLVTVQ